jgi:acetolactate synthase-1/2/3 large subunit
MDLPRTVASSLVEAGVRRVFGVPGTQSVELLDAFRREGLPFTLAAHEGGAAFMANGYARAGGGVGVLSTIGGPGFTNALTGVAEARHDSAPLLHLVSVARPSDRAFPLQGTDHRGIVASLVKRSFVVSERTDAPRIIEQALALATSGEPGPVLVELGADTSDVGDSAESHGADLGGPSPSDWDILERRWIEAERPVFFVGQGCLDCAAALERLCTRLRVPILTTPSARGIIAESSPLALGFDTLRGGVEVLNGLLARADLVLAVGCKLTHNGTAGFRIELPATSLVHVDASSPVLEANYPASLTLATSAESLLGFLEARPRPSAAWSSDEIAEARLRLRTPEPSPLEPRVVGGAPQSMDQFFRWLRGVLAAETILVTDSGQHQISTRRHFEVESPRGLVIPSDFQSMGFGVPAAVGARLASPNRPVAVITGDGGFLMSGMELTTAVRERLPLLCVVFADGYLNQIRLSQLSESGHAIGVEPGRLSLEGFAHSAGIDYIRFGENLGGDRIAEAFRGNRPTLVEVPVGDAAGLAGTARKAKAKEWVRESLGPERLDRLKGWLSRVRGRGSR